MNRLLTAALAGCLLVLAAPGARADDDWETIRNDSETFSIRVPKGYEFEDNTRAERVMTIQYPQDVFRKLRIEINTYKGQSELEHLVKFGLQRLKGAYGEGQHELVEGSQSRFISRPTAGDATFMSLSEAYIQGEWGTIVTLVIIQDAWEEYKDTVYGPILDSFTVYAPPENKFHVPDGWVRVESDTHFLLGPVADEGEKVEAPVKEARERKLYMISTQWIRETFWVAIRELMGDNRKFFRKGVLHVYPTRAMFRRAVGERYEEGVNAVYLPEHVDRIVAIDASDGGTLTREEVLSLVALQYVDTRAGGLPAWMRRGLIDYWHAAALRDPVFPGAKDDKLMEAAKEIFRKKVMKFEELRALDEAGIRAMGESGRLLCYALVQFQLHADGDDVKIRDAMRRFLRSAADTFDNENLWNELHADIKDRDIDSAVKKWIRSWKPPRK